MSPSPTRIGALSSHVEFRAAVARSIQLKGNDFVTISERLHLTPNIEQWDRNPDAPIVSAMMDAEKLKKGGVVTVSRIYAAEGMPDLDMAGRPTSFFEFWPTWLMYAPVVIQWLLLGIRYRSFTLPLIANPAVPLSGMVGVAKTDVLEQASSETRQWILPWITHDDNGEPVSLQLRRILPAMADNGIIFPIVAKPDIGCRGAGVCLLAGEGALAWYLTLYPRGARLVIQQLAPWEPEAGVFYVRHPGAARGQITSLTLKYSPYVVGDGHSTLQELIATDPRAGMLQHLYQSRHEAQWNAVIPAGQPYRLVFSASHCRGAIFRDGREFITEPLTLTLDRLFDGIPGYHYGRLDIKFRSIEALMRGEDFRIIEINGASSESLHIWDRETRLVDAIGALLAQYQTLFKLGHENRRRGHRPPGLWRLWHAWRQEVKLTALYPENH